MEGRTMAEVVGLAPIVGDKFQRTVRRDKFGMFGHEICVQMRVGSCEERTVEERWR